MPRDQEASPTVEAKEAKRRLRIGIESSRTLLEQYRARLLAMTAADELSRGRLILLNPNR
jgi:hypothetical protein